MVKGQVSRPRMLLGEKHRPWHQQRRAGVRRQTEKPSRSPLQWGRLLLPPPWQPDSPPPTSFTTSQWSLCQVHIFWRLLHLSNSTKDEHDIPQFRSVKDNKASPCSMVKFKRPVSHEGLNTVSTPCSLSRPPRSTSIPLKGDY